MVRSLSVDDITALQALAETLRGWQPDLPRDQPDGVRRHAVLTQVMAPIAIRDPLRSRTDHTGLHRQNTRVDVNQILAVFPA